MKRHRWKKGKRLTAMVLAVAMVVTSITFVPTQEVQAGAATASAKLGKYLAKKSIEWVEEAAGEYLERGICYGLEEASNAYGGENKALNTMLTLLKSPEENMLDEVAEMCEEIMDELDNVEKEIDGIEAMVSELEVEMAKLGIQDQTRVIEDFADFYTVPAEKYKELLEEMKRYTDDPSIGTGKMDILYGELKESYSDKTLDDMLSDIYTFGHANSKYTLADTVEEEGTWKLSPGDSAVKTTYLGAIAKYYEDTTASQPWMYQAIYSNLNDMAKLVYYYLQDLQIYTVMSVNEINTDASLSRAEREKQIQNQWDKFEKGRNRAANLVNQMAYEAKTELKLDTLMRPYDMVPTKVTMDYQEERTVNVEDVTDRTLHANKTEEEMWYSILKLTNGTTYAIYSDGGTNETLTLGDMIDVTDAEILFFDVGTHTDISCDYLNLFQGKDAWEGFHLISSSESLINLTSEYNSYSRVGNQLWTYLVKTEQIPNLIQNAQINGKDITYDEINPFYGITSHYEKRAGGGATDDMSIYFYPLQNVPSATPGSVTEKKSLESEIYDQRKSGRTEYPVGIIMKQEAGTEVPLTLSIPGVQGLSVKVENLDKTDESGNPTVLNSDENGNYTIAAGDRLAIKVKIDDTTKEIGSAVLFGEAAKELTEEDDEWATMDTFVDESDAKDFTSYRNMDEDGYYTLATFPMLYRNSKIEIKTKEAATVNSYLAELKQPETGIRNLQFDGMPGIDAQAEDAGSKVKVVVWPTENQIAKGIILTDNDGNVLTDVDVTEVDNRPELPEEARTYTFIMPESDVTISADLEDEYKVTLKSTKDGKLAFVDADGQTLSYSTNEAAYHAGDRVYIKGIADTDSYYCSDIRVNCQNTGKYVRVRVEEEGISFIMPEEDVQVTGKFEEKNGSFEVAIDTIRMNETANGTVTTADGESASRVYYKAGEKVTLLVKPEEGSWMQSYSVKRRGSDEEVNSQCETTQENLGFQTITFLMPRQNVDVEVKFNSDTSVIYNGTLWVDAGLKGKIAETKEEKETEILSDVINGQADFTARGEYTYILAVEAVQEGAVPKVTYNDKVLAETKDGDQYLYRFQADSQNFKLNVENVGEKGSESEDKIYDYLIPDYETLCFYWDKIQNDSNFRTASYLVTADIEAPDTATTEDLGDAKNFSGILDGGGHKIKGLKLNHGLLPDLQTAVIKNLELEDVTVGNSESTGDAGAFTDGMNISKSAIVNCKVTGKSVIYGSEIGGIAGYVNAPDTSQGEATAAVIENCSVEATLICTGTDKNRAGGISGASRGAIENCYFAGKIKLSDQSKEAENKIAGIALSDPYDSNRGSVWNCYVQDNFADESIAEQNNVTSYDIYDINNGNNINSTYIPWEMFSYLNQNTTHHILNSNVNHSLSVSEMTSAGFATTLNSNLQSPASFVKARTGYKDAEVGKYKSWNWDADKNNGYPYLEEPQKKEPYSVEIVSVPEKSSLEVKDYYEKNENVYRCLDGEKITLEGITELEKVEIVAKNKVTGDILLKTECKPDESGKVSTSFRMPSADVEVIMTEPEVYGGTVSVDTAVIPADLAEVSIQDTKGNIVEEATSSETIYLNTERMENGYEIGKFIFKSNVSLKPYKTVEAKDVLQEDGRYAVTIAGSEDVLRGKVTIYAVLQKKSYTIDTSVTPENSGTIDVSADSAKAGDEVSYTVTPAKASVSCKSLLLCDEEGNVLKTLNCTKSQGTFTMPTQNVILKATFRGATYQIETKDSDDLTLGTADESGNSVKFAQAGETIMVHYSRNSWTAYELISVYKADEYESENAEPLYSWTAKKKTDAAEEAPFTFTMPEGNVVIAAEAMPEGDYTISKEAEGSGSIYVRDMASGNKSTANEGELIFASAFAEKGWSLEGDSVTIYDEDEQKVSVINRERFVAFKMPAENLKVKAVFVQNEYVITVEQPEKGSISITDKDGNTVDLTKVHYGDELKIKVTGSDMKTVHYKETGAENASVYNISLNENKEAVFTMPDKNITISEGYAMVPDENGTYLISSFEELEQVADIVKEQPNANFRLTADISGKGQTLTEAIGSAEVPYTGTFDGYGHYIFNFKMSNPDGDAALFGTIGTEGTVKRLSVFYQTVTGKRASGVATVNNGMIDECISGANLTSTTHNPTTGEEIPLASLNTFVNGEDMAGGVAVENNGTIRNTASYASVTASGMDGVAGGIAAVNNGVIENSYSKGKISAGTMLRSVGENGLNAGGVAGGIAGKNTENGSIHIAYAAALDKKDFNAITAGAIYGVNEGTVTDTYYLDSLPGGTQQGTAMTVDAMKKDSFTDTLNAVDPDKENLREWYRQTGKNDSYPVLRSSVVEEMELTDINTNLTVQGKMHVDSELKVERLENTNEVYQAFQKYAEANQMQVQLAAAPSLVYADGNEAPTEGMLKLKLDLSKYKGKGYKALVYKDGKVEEVKVDEQMIANRETEKLSTFAVLTEKTSTGKDADKTVSDDSKKTKQTSKTAVAKTGDNGNVWFWTGMILVAGAFAGCTIGVRRKKEHQNRNDNRK